MHAEYSSVLQQRKLLTLKLSDTDAKLQIQLEKTKELDGRGDTDGGEYLVEKCLVVESELRKSLSDCQAKDEELMDTRAQLHSTQVTVRGLREQLAGLELELGTRQEKVNSSRL